jgi:exodeoxyribonuclease V beta subunit
MELSENAEPVIKEIAADFFAKETCFEHPVLINLLTSDHIDTEYLLKLAYRVIAHPGVSLLSEPFNRNSLKEFEQTFYQTGKLLNSCFDEISDIFQTDKNINRRSYNKKNTLVWLTDALTYLNAPKPEILPGGDPDNPGLLKKSSNKDGIFHFTISKISKKCNGYCPQHPFFESCENLLKTAGQVTLFKQKFKYDFIKYLLNELPLIKQQSRIQFFDDLILKLHAALNSNKNELKNIIRNRFKAALIDEFQDTDDIQYDIFRKIFSAADIPFF